MRTRSILAATFGAAALLAAVPAGAALADPGPSRPSFSKSHTKPQAKPQGWTLCAVKHGRKAGTIRLATKFKPCTRWETSIPVAPVVEEQDDKPAPYWLKEGATMKYCAPKNKVRGTWVIECKTFGQPKPAPTAPTATATAKPAS